MSGRKYEVMVDEHGRAERDGRLAVEAALVAAGVLVRDRWYVRGELGVTLEAPPRDERGGRAGGCCRERGRLEHFVAIVGAVEGGLG
jgi:hypothetical protein